MTAIIGFTAGLLLGAAMLIAVWTVIDSRRNRR